MYPTAYGLLPRALKTPLFGDRERWGRSPDETDPEWRDWLKNYFTFYAETQKSGVGKIVNDSGYRILGAVDFTGKRVLEIGPGILPHRRFWRGKPAHYTVADIKPEFLAASVDALRAEGIPSETILSSDAVAALPERSFDYVVSFYALEHIADLDRHVADIHRVLRPGGALVGAIPCEGGLAWGLGRALTSRRYALRNFEYDPDKIICWEHPNFARDILSRLDKRFTKRTLRLWPLAAPLIDINLTASFIYEQ